jgi:signal transduction histidine kinase
MEAMGGRITIDGAVGAGTIVTIWLPAERSDHT